MIALKEIKAVRHGLHQNLDAIHGRTVKLYQDNMAVVGALRKMSSRYPALMTDIKECRLQHVFNVSNRLARIGSV
jgi:hypothetical protein